jgi:hypothetical protein
MTPRPIAIIEPQIRRLVDGRLSRIIRPVGPLASAKPGLLLWVREPFWLPECYNHLSPSQAADRGALPNFIADHPLGRVPRDHCKRRFARELLRMWHRQHLVLGEIATVRLQALTDTEIDEQGFATREGFARAWDQNLALARSTQKWAANPEALSISFRRVARPVEELARAA